MSDGNNAGADRVLKRVRLIAWLLVPVAAAALLITVMTRPAPETPLQPAQETGLPKVGGAFKLTAHTGATVTDRDHADKHKLIFFGYTHCPDICPTVLRDVTAALDEIGGKANQIQPYFITVDPARDTADFLRDYMENFHPSILGLTGEPRDIRAVADAYRVFYAKVPRQGDAEEDYLMDHSTVVYLMDPKGGLVSLFNHTDDAAKIAERLNQLL